MLDHCLFDYIGQNGVKYVYVRIRNWCVCVYMFVRVDTNN